MKKIGREEIKKAILKEAIYIKNLFEEKKTIEEELKKLENEELEDEGISVSRSLRNMKSMPKRLKDKHLKKDEVEEIDEASGVSISSQMGHPTNPQYKSRNKRGYVRKTLKEEDIIRNFVREKLYEAYDINEEIEEGFLNELFNYADYELVPKEYCKGLKNGDLFLFPEDEKEYLEGKRSKRQIGEIIYNTKYHDLTKGDGVVEYWPEHTPVAHASMFHLKAIENIEDKGDYLLITLKKHID